MLSATPDSHADSAEAKIIGGTGNETGKIRDIIQPYLTGKGIDIGCGPWPLSYPNVETADKNPDFKPTFCCSAMRIPVENNRYDFVYSSHTLEHMWFPRKTLKEWLRILKPGGFLILHLPHKYFYPNIFDDGGNADHKNDFCPEIIIRMLEATGQAFLVSMGTLAGEVIARYADRIIYNGPKNSEAYSFYIIAAKKKRSFRESWLLSTLATTGYRALPGILIRVKRLLGIHS